MELKRGESLGSRMETKVVSWGSDEVSKPSNSLTNQVPSFAFLLLMPTQV